MERDIYLQHEAYIEPVQNQICMAAWLFVKRKTKYKRIA